MEDLGSDCRDVVGNLTELESEVKNYPSHLYIFLFTVVTRDLITVAEVLFVLSPVSVFRRFMWICGLGEEFKIIFRLHVCFFRTFRLKPC